MSTALLCVVVCTEQWCLCSWFTVQDCVQLYTASSNVSIIVYTRVSVDWASTYVVACTVWQCMEIMSCTWHIHVIHVRMVCTCYYMYTIWGVHMYVVVL